MFLLGSIFDIRTRHYSRSIVNIKTANVDLVESNEMWASLQLEYPILGYEMQMELTASIVQQPKQNLAAGQLATIVKN